MKVVDGCGYEAFSQLFDSFNDVRLVSPAQHQAYYTLRHVNQILTPVQQCQMFLMQTILIGECLMKDMLAIPLSRQRHHHPNLTRLESMYTCNKSWLFDCPLEFTLLHWSGL